MDYTAIGESIIFLLIYLFGVYLIFTSLLQKLLGGDNELERIDTSKTFTRTFWGLGIFVWFMYVIYIGGLSETLFGIFTGTGVLVVAAYFFAYLKTSHLDAYIVVLTAKNYEKWDYLKIYGKNSPEPVAEGQFYKLTTRSLILLPYRETALVQIPITDLVGQDGLIIKNMDRGKVGPYTFDITVGIDGNITKVKEIILGILMKHKDIMSSANPPWVSIYPNLGYNLLRFTYYCHSNDKNPSGYMRAKSVWNGLGFRIIEELRANKIKIGLKEELWWNGEYKQRDDHLNPDAVRKRLEDPKTMSTVATPETGSEENAT